MRHWIRWRTTVLSRAVTTTSWKCKLACKRLCCDRIKYIVLSHWKSFIFRFPIWGSTLARCIANKHSHRKISNIFRHPWIQCLWREMLICCWCWYWDFVANEPHMFWCENGKKMTITPKIDNGRQTSEFLHDERISANRHWQIELAGVCFRRLCLSGNDCNWLCQRQGSKSHSKISSHFYFSWIHWKISIFRSIGKAKRYFI